VAESLRARVRYLHHDLTAARHAPAGLKFGLVCCRNTLIYFRRPVQQRVQRLLYDSLMPGGYLCLGEAEWLSPDMEQEFEVIDPRARLFRARTCSGPCSPLRGAP
jgi:chemotaxis protein methyltransferase CheR